MAGILDQLDHGRDQGATTVSDLLSGIVGALVVPGVALAFRYVLQMSGATRTRELMVDMPEGPRKTIKVIGASSATISKAVLHEYELQERVLAFLTNHRDTGNVKFGRGNDMDFILETQAGSRTGIVIKTQFGKHAFDEIDEFQAGKLGVEKLLLLVSGEIPPRVIRQTAELVQSGRLQLESIPESAALETHLAKLLGVPQQTP